jgi:hypothetical protein
MVYYTVHYRFSQSFPFPVEEAFAWASDYDPGDIRLMGKEGTREIERIDEDTLVLDDTIVNGNGTVRKRRLVRLFPELHALTNTRLSGPNRHSQFIYQFLAEGEKGSRLEFTGAQVNRAATRPSPADVAALAEVYATEDSGLWVNLAEAMKKDLGPRRRRDR